MTTSAPASRAAQPLRRPHPRGTKWGWIAVGVTAAFVAISWWWVTQDRSVPSGDAASHLFTATTYRALIAEGNLSALLSSSGYYPPATFLVGAVSALIGGVGVAAPVIGANLVYVPLLAVGCFQTGRLLAGPRAGALAVLFALGSPLLIEQFHVFMLEAPQAALVALSVWLILASRRFSRVGVAALAGLAVGLGMVTKEQFPLYVVGLLAVVVLRGGGWRNRKGLAAFTAVALAVAGPWYVMNVSDLGWYVTDGGLGKYYVLRKAKPPLVSLDNATWYAWAVLNSLLFAPLFAFASIGVCHAVARLRRHAAAANAGWTPELLGGLFGGWLAMTLTPHHDLRYALPLIVYLAVFGTAWIVALRCPVRLLVTATLVLSVAATTLGAAGGVGGAISIPLGRQAAGAQRRGVPPTERIVLYSDRAFRVSGPRREDDVLGFMRALRREGVTGIAWEYSQSPFDDPVFDFQGVTLFARFAGLWAPEPTWSYIDGRLSEPHHAMLVRARALRGLPPCMQLSDGSALWVLMAGTTPFCPAQRTWAGA